MNHSLIFGALLIGLFGMLACASQQGTAQQPDLTPSAQGSHSDERLISGHLYRHGSQIHHHPEREHSQATKPTE